MVDDKNFIEELWIKLRADILEFHNGMIKASADLKAFTAKVGASHAEMQKFGKGVGVVSTALAVMGGYAAKTFADFEQAMANTFSVLGATKSEMEKMTTVAREFGTTSVFQAKEVGNAMYFLASAGYNAKQTVDALKGTLMLAASTQADLSDATKIVVNTLNAFGMQANEAERVSNAFAASIAYSQAEIDKIGESMKFVAPIASQLGISLEQTTAALGELYDAGLDASQTGTNLRQAFLKLLNPTKEAKEALSKLGLKVSDVSPQAKDLVGIIQSFEKVGAGAKDKLDELAAIFDARAVTAMAVLINKGSEALLDMEKRITGTSKASEMANIQMNTLTGSTKLFMGNLNNLLITIGEVLAPTIRKIADVFINLIKYFQSLNPAFKTLLITIPALATVFGLLISPIALLIGYLPKIIAGIGVLKVVMTGAGGAVLGWVSVIGLLIAAVGYLVSANETTSRSTDELIGKMNEYTTSAIQQKETQKQLLDSYLNLASKTKKNSEETEKQKLIFEKIKRLYPDLISATDDYRSAQSKLKTVSENVNAELANLYAQQKRLRELELTINTSKLQQQMKELKTDMEDTSLGLWQSLKSGFKDISGTNLFGNAFNTNLEITKEKFDKLAASTEGLKKLESGLELLSQGSRALSIDLAEVETKIQNIGNRSDLTKIGKKAETDILEKQKTLLESRLDTTDKFVDAYISAIEKGKQLLSIDTNIKENQIELNNLKMGLKTETPVTAETVDINALNEVEKETQKKLNEQLFEIVKNRLESELAILKLNKDKKLSIALEYADKESKLEKAQNDKDKADALIDAKETGANVIEIKKSFDAKEKSRVEVLAFNINEIRQQFRDKDVKEEWNKLSVQNVINEDELNNYKKHLQDKLSFLESMDEKWTDEYTQTVNEIKKINEMIAAPQEQKLKFNVDMSQYSIDEDQKELALENYKAYLDEKLIYEEEFSEQWYEIASERARIEKELIDMQMSDMQIYFDSFAEVINAGIGQMSEEWLVVSRKAKSQLDAIWLAVENAAIRAMTNIIQSQITEMFTKLLFKIASFLGSGGTSSFSEAVMGNFDLSTVSSIADTGGIVKRGGWINVKPQEVVVSGEVVRGTKDKYQSALGADSKSMNQTVENNNTFLLVNPMVDDQKYWESVMENQLNPIQEKLDKRFGRKT